MSIRRMHRSESKVLRKSDARGGNRAVRRAGLLLTLALLLTGWRLTADIEDRLDQESESLTTKLWELTWFAEPISPLTDNVALYKDDQGQPVINEIYITVLPAQDGSTFASMNQITDYRSPRPILPVVFSTAPAGLAPESNATITLRGHSTMTAEKKSYKIKLAKDEQPWFGQLIINLNKHPNDESRIRNKVAYELFRGIPDFVSMRTCFVRLYVKDASEGAAIADFIDYGIFTQIEQPNKDFLKAHGLDEFGSLYKANNFEFLRYEDILLPTDDPNYDEQSFEEILEICAGSSHDKLLRMLADVNNEELDIDKVLDRYFNRDNYFTWLAVNILIGNFDTQSQNYFLYNPHDSLTWYFLPWDYDGSMVERNMTDPDGNPAQLIGAANYWNTRLHQRVLSKPANLAQLCAKIDELHRLLNLENISKTVQRSMPVIEQNYLADPEFSNEITAEEFYGDIAVMLGCVERNYRLFYQDLDKPMPFFLGLPDLSTEQAASGEDGKRTVTLYWGRSFDLQGDKLVYDLQISRDKAFADVLYERAGLRTLEHIVLLPEGKYYWRVMARDAKGNRQRAFDIYWDEGEPRNIHTGLYGAAGFTVEEVADDGL